MLRSRKVSALALTVLCLLAGLTQPAMAQQFDDFHIYATPQPLPPGAIATLIATGVAPCAILLPPEIDGDRIVVPVATTCPFLPPDSEPFRLETTVGPLGEGTYTVDLTNNTNDFVLATTELEAGEPVVDVELSPAVATTRDRIAAAIAGFASCPRLDSVEIGQTRLDLDLTLDCPFTPPEPPADFVFHTQLGRLPAGEYEVVVRAFGEPVGSRHLTVYEAPEVLVLDPAEPTTDAGFTATAGIARVVTCDPVSDVSIGPFFLDVHLESDCLEPALAGPPPVFSTVEASFPALAAGSYRIRFIDNGSVLAQAPVVVRTEGLCTPSETALCLQGGRFRVSALWTTPDGVMGPGHASPRTSDTGELTFFDPDNVELVVKVLDACNTSFDSFWVFAAGLTNVGVRLQVTDTLHQVTRVYTSPRGTNFQPILNTVAFRTCP